MLVKFTARNFHSIKDEVTLSFEATNSDELEDYYIIKPKEGVRLLKLGLIYGPNGSGKTTILDALSFLKQIVLKPLQIKTEAFKYKPFLFDDETPMQSSFFSIEFYQLGIKYLYEVELNRQYVVSENLYFHNPNKALVYSRTTDASTQTSKIEFGKKVKIKKEFKTVLEANTLWNNTVLGGFIKTNIESIEIQAVIDWFFKVLQAVIRPDTDLFKYISNQLEKEKINKEHVISLLQKADFNISDIVVEKGELEVDEKIMKYLVKSGEFSSEDIEQIKEEGKIKGKDILFNHRIEIEGEQKEYQLSYTDESSGTQRYYQFSGLLDLMLKSEKIFLIDELESSLHPDLIKHFLLSFLVNTHKSQLIASTHYRELMMEKDILRNDAINFTEKLEDGSTDLYKLTDFNSSVIRDTSSVFNAYKIGKLGATPELGDHYIDTAYGEEEED
jgi:AAA15 family ATPase/GTPase